MLIVVIIVKCGVFMIYRQFQEEWDFNIITTANNNQWVA